MALTSIDQNGMVQGFEVVYRSGDEAMLARAQEVMRGSRFEPARLGDHAVSATFLYLATTTEVRPDRRLSSAPSWQRLSADNFRVGRQLA